MPSGGQNMTGWSLREFQPKRGDKKKKMVKDFDITNVYSTFVNWHMRTNNLEQQMKQFL